LRLISNLAVFSHLRTHFVGAIGLDRGKAACFAAHTSESRVPCILNHAKLPKPAGFFVTFSVRLPSRPSRRWVHYLDQRADLNRKLRFQL
jgi:hypothetical protein